jgi:hypothetical protein
MQLAYLTPEISSHSALTKEKEKKYIPQATFCDFEVSY